MTGPSTYAPTTKFTRWLDSRLPILRFTLRYKNLTPATTHINSINMVPWTFDDLGKRYSAFRVNQWSVSAKPEDFQPSQTLLDTVPLTEEFSQVSWQCFRQLLPR